MDLDEPVSLSPKTRAEHARYRRWRSRFTPDERFIVPKSVVAIASFAFAAASIGVYFWERSTAVIIAGAGIGLHVLKWLVEATFRGPRDPGA